MNFNEKQRKITTYFNVYIHTYIHTVLQEQADFLFRNYELIPEIYYYFIIIYYSEKLKKESFKKINPTFKLSCKNLEFLNKKSMRYGNTGCNISSFYRQELFINLSFRDFFQR